MRESIEMDENGNEPCDPFHHKWVETYYGWECEICGMFVPFGCEPWMPLDDDY